MFIKNFGKLSIVQASNMTGARAGINKTNYWFRIKNVMIIWHHSGGWAGTHTTGRRGDGNYS